MEYKVHRIDGQSADTIEKILNANAPKGWVVVAITGKFVVLAKLPPATKK